MSTFTKYLTEATKTYEYKVKIAGDIDKDFSSRMETACQKFELKKLTAGKKTPIQSLPLDFPQLKNESVTIFELTTSYPVAVNELREEGAVQILYDIDQSKRDPILAAVGQLQLEVVQHRLESEYSVETRVESMGFQVARWVSGGWSSLDEIGRIFNCKT